MPNNTLATNLQRLVTAKSDIADAITAKGGTVNEGDGFEEFPADILTIPTPPPVYGYHVNPSESDPAAAVTYVEDAVGMTPAKMGSTSFSYGSWGDAWFLPKPCVLKYDGTVDYYLDPNDYTKKADGTAATITTSNTTGNVMMEFPKIYIKRVPGSLDGERTVYIAQTNVDGNYKCFSNVNASNQEIDHFYMAAYDICVKSSKTRSLSGVTLNSTNAPEDTIVSTEVSTAVANGASAGWYTGVWADWCLVYDLLYLMGKSLDLQRTYGQGITTGSSSAKRAYTTGSLNDKGLFYGDTSGQNTAVKTLGIENFWGLRYKRIAGLLTTTSSIMVKMTRGTYDGSTASDYNTTGTGYLNFGTPANNGGYVSKMTADNVMGYKATAFSGSSSTYYCDYGYYGKPSSGTYYAGVGGSSGYGADGGFCVSLASGASISDWYVGGSLSCKP